MRTPHLVPPLAATAAALLAAAGCGGSQPPAPAAAPASPTSSAPASTAPAGPVAFGAPGTVSDGYTEVTVTVTAPTVHSSPGNGSWLTVRVHAENRSTEDSNVPTIGVWCTGAAKPGRYLSTSTLEVGLLPARSSREGTLDLMLPGGQPAPECKTPAYVQAEPLLSAAPGPPPVVRWQLPADVVAALNAHRGR